MNIINNKTCCNLEKRQGPILLLYPVSAVVLFSYYPNRVDLLIRVHGEAYRGGGSQYVPGMCFTTSLEDVYMLSVCNATIKL